MKEEEMRVAIALALGAKWKRFSDSHTVRLTFSDAQVECGRPERVRFSNTVPDYCRDLNAIAEAEKTLTKEQCRTYQEHLMDIVTHGSPAMKECEAREGFWCARWTWHATALQRAEAFLRTLGKYTETAAREELIL